MLSDKVVYPYKMDETDYVLVFQIARKRGVSTKQVLDEAVRMYIQNQKQAQGGEEK